jgi:hypothetical protein
MRLHGWLFFPAILALLAAQMVASVAPAHAKETKSLQVMFLDGAVLRAGPSNDSAKLATAECGDVLRWQNEQDGQWFLVKMGELDGWVNGNLVTFDISPKDYCHAVAPQGVLVNAGLADPPAEVSVSAEQAPAASGSVQYGGMEEIICQAAVNYGQDCQAMINVASCESTLNPNAVGRAGEIGLFQFLPGTWSSTPYAGSSPYDPVANANAAAWMWSVGRRGEWYC